MLIFPIGNKYSNNHLAELIMQIVYIHGANSTPTTFNYIKRSLPQHEAFDISYRHDIPLIDIIRNVYEALPDGPVYIVAHSLGGLIAVAVSQLNHASQTKDIQKIMTISSPFGGCKGADILKWMYPSNRLFSDISTVSPVIKAVTRIGAVVPTKCIVTNHGSIPLIRGENDGVVSVESQMSLKGAQYAKQSHNHFEVLLSDDTVAKVKEYFVMI
jgi:pimeloyl-ACP methyl ester carboxylesterase